MSTKTWIWIGVVLLVGVIVYFLFIKKKSTAQNYAPVNSYNAGTNASGTLNLNDILVAGTGLVSALSQTKTTTTTNNTTTAS